MGVLEVIGSFEERPAGAIGWTPHYFMATIGEYIRGRVTGAQALNALNLTGAARTEVSDWVTGFPRTDPSGNTVSRDKIHDTLMLLEAGLYTVAQTKTELDWP